MQSRSKFLRRASAMAGALGALMVLVALATPASAGGPGSRGPTQAGAGHGKRGNLSIYYRSPVLVRPGEHVLIPVDIMCATRAGTSCPATVSLSVGDPVGGWRTVSALARPGVGFDLTRPAARASAGPLGDGSLAFRLSAAGGGSTTSLPAAGMPPLRLYAASRMAVVRMPAIPFGRVRPGRVVLYLPWGTGPARAGLAPGMQSATFGPSSFDVDGRGRIYLADPMQSRVAVFFHGKLVRQTRLPLAPRTDLALAANGTTYLAANTPAGEAAVRGIDRSGRISAPRALGRGLLSELRTSGSEAYAHLLPLDAWVPATGRGAPGNALSVGRPTAGGVALLKAIDGNSVRVGILDGGQVTSAVELRSKTPLGELALAEPDGAGGFLVVVHVWRSGPAPADQYQVVDARGSRILFSFAVANREFAETMALSRFRLGRDGDLYQITSSPDGMRILRYRIGGQS